MINGSKERFLHRHIHSNEEAFSCVKMKNVLSAMLALTALTTAAPSRLSPTPLDPPAPPTVTAVPTFNFTQLHSLSTHFLDQMMVRSSFAGTPFPHPC